MKPLYYILINCILLTSCSTKKPSNVRMFLPKEHSLAEELSAFYDITLLPEYLDSTFCAQVSSYDTTGNNDDGFSGTYSFLKRNEDGSLVIFDQKGSGVINRIWTPTPTEDTLDFFIDDKIHPAFSICYLDLFSGKRYPFVAPLCGNQLGGYYCYLPIPFASSCKIVCRGKKMQFHQIQYRLYENGAKVIPFKIDLNSKEKESLEKIASLWNKENRTISDFYSNRLSEKSQQFEIKPGETVTVFEWNEGGRIAGIELSPAGSFEGLTKNMDIKITWDDEKNPAVFCPVADFFGYAFGKISIQSLLLGSRDNINYCYFPMPFDKSAKIELVYRKIGSLQQSPFQVSVSVRYSTDSRITDKEGKFYSSWNKNLRSQPGKPHVFLNINGKGHYVGTILQAQGLQAGMTYFFEGDDSASVDGSPRIHGTGSEDYFNGGWYAMMDRWDGKMSLPLHGAMDYSLPFCRTGGYRFYISDKLSFENNFFMSIEHGPAGNKFPVDYTSLALYYSDAPAIESTAPDNELSEVYIPDTLIIYPQLMDYNIFGNLDVKTTWKYGTGGESYLFTPGSDSWLRISLADIPPGRYSVLFDVMKEPFGCEFSLWQRQTRLSDWISTYQANEERDNNLYVCDIGYLDFINTITIRCKTDKLRSSLLLNRIILVKKG
jgi:hypothetical protein